MAEVIRVLFVCSGNICRSPSAEGVFCKRLNDLGLSDFYLVDSAGTHGFHRGESPDSRSQKVAKARGYDLSALRARQVTYDDFEAFDYILAMDRGHMLELERAAPPSAHDRLHLLMHFAPEATTEEVKDPYYGGPDGFERVLDDIELGVEGLIRHLEEQRNSVHSIP